jgi:hypothetical protein
MKRNYFLYVFVLGIVFTACKDKTDKTPESATAATSVSTTSTIPDESVTTDTIPYKWITKAEAMKWYANYSKLIADASKTPPPPVICFDPAKIVQQAVLDEKTIAGIKYLKVKMVKYCVVSNDAGKISVILQVKFVDGTFRYYDLSQPAVPKSATDDPAFCPPPPGCALEEA